jgi:hypothetical protein
MPSAPSSSRSCSLGGIPASPHTWGRGVYSAFASGTPEFDSRLLRYDALRARAFEVAWMLNQVGITK